MSAHTEGRLTLGKFASASGGPEIQYINGSAAQQVFHCQPMESADHAANARRLVACWNACDGVQTEGVEALAAVGGVAFADKLVKQVEVAMTEVVAMAEEDAKAAAAERDQLRAEMAAARALLDEVVNLDDDFNVYVTESGESYNTEKFNNLTDRVRALLKGGAV